MGKRIFSAICADRRQKKALYHFSGSEKTIEKNSIDYSAFSKEMDTQFSRLFVYYLRLRLRTINRQVRAWGMVPWVFWACVIPLFLLISWNLVERGLYMRIAYLLAGLSLTQIA